MPLEIAALAASVVGSFLVPFVKEGAKKLCEAVRDKFSEAAGDEAVHVTKSIWDRVKEAFSSDKEKATLEQFEEFPDEGKSLVEAMLLKKLKEDPKLAADLGALVHKPGPEGKSILNMVADSIGYVDARGATISGGIVAGYVSGTPPPMPGGPRRPPPAE
jgi:hypothetical protein